MKFDRQLIATKIPVKFQLGMFIIKTNLVVSRLGGIWWRHTVYWMEAQVDLCKQNMRQGTQVLIFTSNSEMQIGKLFVMDISSLDCQINDVI